MRIRSGLFDWRAWPERSASGERARASSEGRRPERRRDVPCVPDPLATDTSRFTRPRPPPPRAVHGPAHGAPRTRFRSNTVRRPYATAAVCRHSMPLSRVGAVGSRGGRITLGVKRPGKRRTGNPFAPFEAAEAGDGLTANLHGHEAGNCGYSQGEPSLENSRKMKENCHRTSPRCYRCGIETYLEHARGG